MVLSVDLPSGVYTYMYWALSLPAGVFLAAAGCLAGGAMRNRSVVVVSSAIPFVVFAVVATKILIHLR